MSFKIELSWTESAWQKVTENKYFKLERVLKSQAYYIHILLKGQSRRKSKANFELLCFRKINSQFLRVIVFFKSLKNIRKTT